MEKGRVLGLGGVFFKCKNTKAQAKWYQNNLGIVPEDWGGSVFKWHTLEDKETIATTTWGPFKEDTEYFNPSKKDFMFNYRVDDLAALLTKLEVAGIKQVGDMESHEYGKFAWILDPEGNKIELWEPVDGIFQ